MERSLHNRIYINPNFKRTVIDSRPTEPVRTAHFNEQFGEKIPNRITDSLSNEILLGKRKIYVNPNFINGNSVPSIQSNCKPVIAEYNATNENMNNESNRSLNHCNHAPLHKSKYSLINDLQQNETKCTRICKGIEKSNAQVSCPEINKNIMKQIQEVPLTRSRYCIVRKKKKSATVEQKSGNLLKNSVIAKHPENSSLAKSNKLTCYSGIQAVSNSENITLSYTPEKVTKIKISKYKIIPANYLRKNTVVQLNQNKLGASPLKNQFQNYSRLSSSPVTSKRNRFKFIREKSSISVSTIKTSSRILHKMEKGVLPIEGKAKLSKVPRANFNINNIPCRLFTKYGKCLRQDRGNCQYLHDKKHVSMCRKFLKGICHDENCALSHEPSDKKMPTCYFYLKGMCTKESCPYLHVKLSEKTKICKEFLKGYCESGDRCPFRHVNVDKLKKTGKLASNSLQRGILNEVSESKEHKTKKEYKNAEYTESSPNLEEPGEKDLLDCRYYKELVKSDNRYDTIKPSRCKLGILPSYIQL